MSVLREILRNFRRNLLFIGGGWGIAEGCALAAGTSPVPGDLAGIALGAAASVLACRSVHEPLLRRVTHRPRRTMTPDDYRRLREMEIELGWEPSELPATLTELPPSSPEPLTATPGVSAGPALSGTGSLSAKGRPVDSVWSTGGSSRCICPACQQSMREGRGKVPDAVAAEHFAQLARVGREHCLSYCPICAERDQPHRGSGRVTVVYHSGAVEAVAGGGGGGTWDSALREATIATMEPGRPYWAVPWAMLAGEDGRLWLRPGYTAWDCPGGSASMRVELREDGCHVWPVPGETYTPGPADAQSLIPVAVLEGER